MIKIEKRIKGNNMLKIETINDLVFLIKETIPESNELEYKQEFCKEDCNETKTRKKKEISNTVSKLRLGIFHPSYNKPYVLEMPYLQNEIDALFGLRSEVIF